MRNRALTYCLFILFVSALCLRVLMDHEARADPARSSEVIGEVRQKIKDYYVETVDDEKLLYGALSGMVRGLDEHSQFLPPDEFRNMMIQTEGSFGGLGVEISMKDGWLTVVTPLLGTPAYRAGVLAGDRIIGIEGESTRGKELNDAVKVLRGKPGSKVTITVFSRGATKPRKVVIKRAIIKIQAVRFSHLIEDTDKIGYVKVISFQSDTTDGLRGAVEELLKKDMKALIIDLRNNPGGLLDQAVAVSDLFLESGDIVSTKGRAMRRSNSVRRARKPGTLKGFPIVVLMNEFSASASEIVAAALRDNDRARLVGQKSYGKGSVQTILEVQIRKGVKGALKLTTAKYFTPAGISIHGTGIQPDLKIKMSIEQLRAVEERQQSDWILRNQPGRLPVEPGAETPKTDPVKSGEAQDEPVSDTQVDKAIEYLQLVLTDGEPAGVKFVAAHQKKLADAEKERLAKEKLAENAPPAPLKTGKPTPHPPNDVAPTPAPAP
jgi:carboxyl-terminal processing protease